VSQLLFPFLFLNLISPLIGIFLQLNEKRAGSSANAKEKSFWQKPVPSASSSQRNIAGGNNYYAPKSFVPNHTSRELCTVSSQSYNNATSTSNSSIAGFAHEKKMEMEVQKLREDQVLSCILF
jgi:hypothetical protein